MKVLLDENLPGRLKNDLSGHQAFTVYECGWAGKTNGNLLESMIEASFQALITFDKNLQHQQNFQRYTISVIVLNAPDNRYATLKMLMPSVVQILNSNPDPGVQVVSQ
jgi:hypothetical protein